MRHIKKNVIAIFTVAAVLAILMLLLAGCGGLSQNGSCSHIYVDADCLNPKICRKCGATTGEALGHSLDKGLTFAPTCEEEGYTEYACSREGCDYDEHSEKINALGHNLGSGVTVAPTCAGEGYIEYLCLREGCDHEEHREKTSALGHNLESGATVLPTCTEDGYTEYGCTRTGCTYKEDGDAVSSIGHFYDGGVTVPATQSTDGYTEYTCIRAGCGHRFRTDYVYYLIYCGIGYGYDDLLLRSNADLRRQFYDDLFEKSAQFHVDGEGTLETDNRSVAFEVTSELSFSEMIETWKVFKNDNPIFYWLDNCFSASGNTASVYVNLEYRLASVRTAYNEAINLEVAEYLQAVEGLPTWEKLFTVHDRMIAAVDYAYDGNGQPESAPWAHNILGIMTGMGAVCEGYAKAFQLILNKLGIECILADGMGITANGAEAHAWNLVKVDGEWYYFDITWDDAGGADVIYKYFAQNAYDFRNSHIENLPTETQENFLYQLPEVNNTVSAHLMTLYKGEVEQGVYAFLSDAFAAMDDTEGDYRIAPYDYFHTGVIELCTDVIVFPTVNSLILDGHYYDMGGGFQLFYYSFLRNVAIDSHLILRNAALTGGMELDIGSYTLTLEGAYSILSMSIQGDASSAVVQDEGNAAYFRENITAGSITLGSMLHLQGVALTVAHTEFVTAVQSQIHLSQGSAFETDTVSGTAIFVYYDVTSLPSVIINGAASDRVYVIFDGMTESEVAAISGTILIAPELSEEYFDVQHQAVSKKSRITKSGGSFILT